MKGHHLYTIAEREIKESDYHVLVFLEKPLYEVCHVRTKKQVSEYTHLALWFEIESVKIYDNRFVTRKKYLKIPKRYEKM